jgi:hypothetical protein
MSTVTGIVYVNPIEPGPLSLRVPSGMETRLELTYYDQLGATIDVDVLGQLELMSRSIGGAPVWCAVPAIDVVNGKARAILPANTLADPNGYRLRLYGTVQGQGMLLATGVVDVVDAIGTTSVPLDVIDNVALTFTRDEDVLLNIAVFIDAAGNADFNLGSTTISATVFTAKGGDAIVAFTVTPIDANEVQLTLPASIVNQLPQHCWWTMVASNAAGMMTLAEGEVTVTGTIALPLPVTTDSWDYVKPVTADNPLSGQIVHSNVTQNILKISALSQPGTDQITLLADLEEGDRITIGATTWTVRFTNYNDLGWYEVAISPILQDAVTGIVPVLFEPPT